MRRGRLGTRPRRPGARRRRGRSRRPGRAIFRSIRFEELEDSGPFDAVAASLSLHHVEDLDAALDKVVRLLRTDGVLVVSEFGHDRLDEPIAAWYHDRRRALAAARGTPAPGLLAECRALWEADHAGLHGYRALRRALDQRFEERVFSWEPYLYRDLDGVATEAVERTLIEAGAIQATGFHYVGVRR